MSDPVYTYSRADDLALVGQQIAARLRRLLAQPSGVQTLTALAGARVPVTVAWLVERTDYSQVAVRKALDRALGAGFTTRQMLPGRGGAHGYTLTAEGREYLAELASAGEQ